MAFTPWRKNKQIMIDDVQQQDPAMSRNAVQQSNPDHHQVNNGSTGFGSVNAERPTFININRLKFFGRRGSCSKNTTTHANENEPIDSDVDCTLRLGCLTEPPSKQQQVQQQLQSHPQPQEGDDDLSAVINNYFPPNNIVPQELMQNYEVMNGTTPPYHQHSQHHINNRFVMNNFNQNSYQLQQQILNNNMIVANHGGGTPCTMNVGDSIRSSDNNMIGNNHGMFHTGGIPPNMNVEGNTNINNSLNFNNQGMFHGGGSPASTMNVRGIGDNSNHLMVNNHGMFHTGGSPCNMNVGANGYTNSNHLSGNNNGMHGGGSPATLNVGVNNSSHLMVNNHGMFHGGGSQNMIVNNNGMFHGGGRSFSMNVGGNSSRTNSNNFGMLHGGRGGGDLSSVVLALPSPGVGPVGDGLNGYNIPYPLPPPLPPNNFHVPFPNNNIPPFPAPQLPPAQPVFLAAPRTNEGYPHNYPPPPSESVKRCFACNTARTPLWRNGPKGPKSLCNACGIRYKKEIRRIMGAMAPDGGQKGDKRGKF